MATPSMVLMTSGSKELGGTMTLSTNRASTSYTHTINYTWYGRKGTIATDVGDSCTWTPSIANLAPYIPNSTSGVVTFTCLTYENGKLIGSRDSSMTLTLPTSVKPTISSVSITDENGYYAKYGGYIVGISHLNIEIQASGAYGSTISKYTAKVGSGTTQTNTNGVSSFDTSVPLNDVGSVIVTTSAIDSRGRGAYDYKTINTLAYEYPSLAGTTIKRWNTTTNQEDDESSIVRVNVVSNICNVGNKNLNRSTIEIQYQDQVGGSVQSSWTTYTTRTNQGISSSFTVDIPNLSENSRYNVRVVCTDSFGYSTIYSGSADTAKPVIDLKSNGNGIGLLAVSDFDGITLGDDIYLDRSVNTATSIYAKDQSGTKWVEALTIGAGLEASSLTAKSTLTSRGALFVYGGSSFDGATTFDNTVLIPRITVETAIGSGQELTESNALVPMTTVSAYNGYAAVSERWFSLYSGGVRCRASTNVTVSYHLRADGLASGQNIGVAIYKNGVEVPKGGSIISTPYGLCCTSVPSFILYVNAGDVITLQARSTGGGGVMHFAHLTVGF